MVRICDLPIDIEQTLKPECVVATSSSFILREQERYFGRRVGYAIGVGF
jgi:hypothetical protein